MDNYYQILGLNTSATIEEVRRAYRILARRYHPDVNPGQKSAERFRSISDAYRVLSDPEKRKQFDLELEGSLRNRGGYGAYQKQAASGRQSARERFYERKFQEFQKDKSEPRPPPPYRKPKKRGLTSVLSALREGWTQLWARGRKGENGLRVSLVEISLTLKDALMGVKRTVELQEGEHTRKISVRIPPGSRQGSVLRMRAKESREELILLIKIAQHPLMSLQAKGLVIDIPVTVDEALCGGSLSVPTFLEPVELKIPAGTQSGQEMRLPGYGPPGQDGRRIDLFYRFQIRIPTCVQAVGIRDRAGDLARYYEASPRQGLPRSLNELL